MMTLITVRQHVEHQGSVILAEGHRPRVDTHTRTHSDSQVAERREGDEMWSTFKTNAPFARGGEHMPHPPDKATMVFAHKHAADAETERCREQQVCLKKI